MPAKSIKQQKLFAMVDRCQKSMHKSKTTKKDCPSAKIKEMAKKIKPKDVKKFARTKHDDLPEKVEKKDLKGFTEWLKKNYPDFN